MFALDNNQKYAFMCLDFAKAFETVDYMILLIELDKLELKLKNQISNYKWHINLK